MAALSDYLSTSFPSTPAAWSMMDAVPQYRLNETAPNLRQDASIAASRGIQDYTQRTVPGMMNQAAAQGNYGSSGFGKQVQFAATDFGRSQNDISRMLYRNLQSIASQRVMATMGGMF